MVLGGKLSSWHDGDSDLIERGLHTFFGADVELIELMRELGTPIGCCGRTTG